MTSPPSSEAGLESTRGKWMALTAALLGWMFDGLEMGLFPLVARPALQELLGPALQELSDLERESLVGLWYANATAGFLIGAATGGVLFGWLGDRLGRVRAMMLSVLTYALFSGACGFAGQAWQVVALRFVAALGMGGEWSLGVALVMEIWPDRSRAFLAGLIGAAANLGYFLIGALGRGLGMILDDIRGWLLAMHLSEEAVAWLLSNSGWRLLMIVAAAPALLTFFIRIFVPESRRWQHEQGRGTTSSWAGQDLLGVGVGAAGAIAMIPLWALDDVPLAVRLGGSLVALLIATAGYTYPVLRFLQRARAAVPASPGLYRGVIKRMLLGACLGGVALLGTWASLQWAPVWADKIAEVREAKADTQMASAAGAILGTLLGAMLGDWIGRRLAYTLLCLGSLVSALAFYQSNTTYTGQFLATVFVAGGLTASFYGWLPLYLPELFPTAVRATGQGFSFNFGRIIAAVGVLQTANLMGLFDAKRAADRPAFLQNILNLFQNQSGYPAACSVMSFIYVLGLVLIWLAPETRAKPLPE